MIIRKLRFTDLRCFADLAEVPDFKEEEIKRLRVVVRKTFSDYEPAVVLAELKWQEFAPIPNASNFKKYSYVQ